MYVMTVDQRGSTEHGVRVPELLDALRRRTDRTGGAGIVLPFERTVGDEVQAVLDRADVVVDLSLYLQRLGGWSVGIGIGAVDRPLAESARASSGPAFVAAREAVERARVRGVPVPLAVDGPDPDAAREAEAVLQLLAAVVRRRSPAGWEAVDALAGRTQRDVAASLGITAQAVSQRLGAALWEEEVGARPVAARLLERAGPAS